jgi:hypothetical protein
MRRPLREVIGAAGGEGRCIPSSSMHWAWHVLRARRLRASSNAGFGSDALVVCAMVCIADT